MAESLEDALASLRPLLLAPDGLVRAVASGARRGARPPWRRATLRPVRLKDGPRLQREVFDERQAFASNHPWSGDGPDDAPAVVDALLAEPFGTWHVETVTATVDVRVTRKGEAVVSRRAATREVAAAAHDRAKPRLLDPGDPFLRAVGITTGDGVVKPSRQDKYRQVEEFLRLLDADLSAARDAGRIGEATSERPLRVVDLGCGNAYLTFAADAYLAAHGVPAETVGVDVKQQSRDRNAALARQLGVDRRLAFVAAPIAEATWSFPTPREGDPAVDVVLALHACDTATDDALARAVRLRSPLLLAAPCCHHDLQRRLRSAPTPEPYGLLVRHGILRERFADLLTDSLRAQVLRLLGYRVEVVEFVGTEHTPRNVMIRAHRTGAAPDASAWREYDDLLAAWGVVPRLAELLAAELVEARAGARPPA